MATSNLGFQSFYQSELSSNISATDTDIPIASLPTPSEGYLVIEPTVPAKREIIYYTSKGTGKVILTSAASGRGVDGTTGVAHNQGADVIMAPIGKMFADLQNGTAMGTASVNTPNLAFGFTGIILPYGGSSAPTGWLLCDGSTVSRTTYSGLFAIVGTTYGAGDGSTTFTLPDMRGRVPVGKNSGTFSSLGATGGAETHTLTAAQMPSHTHTIPNHQHGIRAEYGSSLGLNSAPPGQYNQLTFNTGYAFQSAYTQADGGGGATSSAGSGSAHNILQPYLVINYIIKT